MDCRIALWAWLLADMLLLLQVPGVQWPALRKGVSRALCNSVRSIYSSLSGLDHGVGHLVSMTTENE
jgi:hypothetical protein